MVAIIKLSVKLFAAMAFLIYIGNTVLINVGIMQPMLFRADLIRNIIFQETITDVSEWQATHKKRTETAYIIIHHDAIMQEKFANTPINEITAYQISKFGEFAYHYYVSATGKVFQLHSGDTALPNALGYNYNSIAICLSGNFDVEKPSEAQIFALKTMLEYLKMQYPNAVICGHTDLNETSCPGANLNLQNL